MTEGTGTTLGNIAATTNYAFTLFNSPTWNTTGGPVIYTDGNLSAISAVNVGDNGGTGGLYINFY